MISHKAKKQSSEYIVHVLAASQINYVVNHKSLLKHITCRQQALIKPFIAKIILTLIFKRWFQKLYSPKSRYIKNVIMNMNRCILHWIGDRDLKTWLSIQVVISFRNVVWSCKRIYFYQFHRCADTQDEESFNKIRNTLRNKQ